MISNTYYALVELKTATFNTRGRREPAFISQNPCYWSRGSWTANREAIDEGANKDKAPMLFHFTVDYGPDMPLGESIIVIGMHFKATDQALQDRRLAGELARMVMLPAN